MTVQRSVKEMVGEPNIPDDRVIGAKCKNGHESKTVDVRPLAEKGSQVRCEECGEPVEQTLLEQ